MGHWTKNKQDGLGIYEDGGGTMLYGRWKDGKREAWITEEEFQKSKK